MVIILIAAFYFDKWVPAILRNALITLDLSTVPFVIVGADLALVSGLILLQNFSNKNKLSGATIAIYIGVGLAITLLPYVLLISRHNLPEGLASFIFRSALRPLFSFSPISFLSVTGAYLAMMAVLNSILRKSATKDVSLNAESSNDYYGGVPLGSVTNETTRFLCASAVILGNTFCKQVLSHLRHKHWATAPEVGLDIETIAHVCNFMEKRELRYRIWLAVLGILYLLFLPVLLLALLLALAISVLWFYKWYEERFVLTQYFTRERFGSAEFLQKFRIKLDHDIANGMPKDDQNLLVYQGFSPFVGAGIDLGGWSFAIDISKPKGQADATTPFEILELYKELESSGKKLLLPSLLVKDFMFVHGTAIRHDESILPDPFDRPMQSLDVEAVKHYSSNSDFRIRHYKWFSVHDWGNEMVFSLFLRCSLRGSNLFVEVSRFLLTPLASQYRQIDTLLPKRWWMLLGMGVVSLLVSWLISLYYLMMLFSYALDWLGKELGFEERRMKREIQNNPLYNYGAANSLRQSMSSPRYLSYFQRLDQEMYLKVLDRGILDTIVAFLDDHDVDTSDLKSQQTTILNSGILVQGGNVEAQSVAVGAGSQAFTTAQSNESPKSPKKE